MADAKHTPGPLKASRAKWPDNTGGYDWAVANGENHIVAEFFEHVAHDGTGGYVTLPAQANAATYVAASDLLTALEYIAHREGDSITGKFALAAIAKATSP